MIKSENGITNLDGTAAMVLADLNMIIRTMVKSLREQGLPNTKAEIKKAVLEALDDDYESEIEAYVRTRTDKKYDEFKKHLDS